MTENYAIELFYESTPVVPKEITAKLETLGGVVEWGSDNELWCSVSFPNHAILLPKPATPRCIITIPDAEFDYEAYRPALMQSWDWPEAAEILRACNSSLLLVDADATGLHYRTRLSLFEDVLEVLLEAASPRAIYWEPCQKFVNPQIYQLARQPGDMHDPFLGPVGVRMFNVQGRNRPERVMDTLGLAALGLRDLQCHFAELDPNAIAHLLYEYAYLILEKGDVIEEGHTVQGLTPESKWRCRHEESLVEPTRPVIDIEPEVPFAGLHRSVELQV